MNYCEWLFNTEAKYLDNEMIIDTESGRRLSYRNLQEEVLKVAAFLRDKGYQPGSVITAHLYNGAETVVVFLAAQYIGAVICLVDPLFKAGELPYYINDSRTQCLITYLKPEEIEVQPGSTLDIIQVAEVEQVCSQPVTPEITGQIMHHFQKDDLALLLYTSGSTSTPKGVMLTTGCFNTFLEKSNTSMYRYSPEDRLLCYVPFSHGYGSVSLLIPALVGKAAIVFLRSFQPLRVASTISAENITHIFGVPTHYQQLLRYENIFPELRKLKAAFCAAAPLSYDTALSWYKNMGIYLDEGYGITEATTLIATRMSMLPEPSGNVGFPPKNILTLEAVGEDGQTCEDGIIGELRLKGPGLMLGYLNRPAETAEKLRNGWLYTGDLGYRRSDGSFVISGRKTEFINVAGLKISPIEIEAVLNSHPGVVDSAAIGIEDSVYGEIVKAFVIAKDKATVSERDLIKYVAGKLANFKVPKFIVFLDEFPRNNIGKIDKKALKNL
jgi:long-chain acyl-CoA synthetase